MSAPATPRALAQGMFRDGLARALWEQDARTRGPISEQAWKRQPNTTKDRWRAKAHGLCARLTELGDDQGDDHPAVVLPAHWWVDEQDGTTPFFDEPNELVPAGIYLIGQDEDSDPETQRVVLRVQLAIDEDGGASGTTEADVVQAIASRLTGAE